MNPDIQTLGQNTTLFRDMIMAKKDHAVSKGKGGLDPKFPFNGRNSLAEAVVPSKGEKKKNTTFSM